MNDCIQVKTIDSINGSNIWKAYEDDKGTPPGVLLSPTYNNFLSVTYKGSPDSGIIDVLSASKPLLNLNDIYNII
jgi:hypothetical protein